jgi:hypothetical protein
MCLNSPDNHAVQYGDLVRVAHGRYELAHGRTTTNLPRRESPPWPAPTAPAPVVVEVEDATKEWFWEGNIQAAIVRHLAATGWDVRRVADTESGEHGIDVDAVRDGTRLVVEVKGYPASVYARGDRRGEAKTYPSATQARQYFAGALLTGMLLRADHPSATVALGFPSVGTYEHLAHRTAEPLRRAGVVVWLVDQAGTVTGANTARDGNE